MGFFQRLANLWNGFLSLWISNLEAENPRAVYEAAINERIKQHGELKKAVSGIVYLRNKLQKELEEKESTLAEVNTQIPVAVESGEDEVAIVLIEKKDQLVEQIETLRAELTKVEGQAETAKQGLISFQGEIEELKREMEEKLAALANAEARSDIQDMMSGLSTKSDLKALENIRTVVDKKIAEADVAEEISGSSLDAKLGEIAAKSKSASAKAQLAEMKKKMAAAQSASAEAGNGTVPKTM
ncbi:MAG: PspA/IM30 family protein [Myxococcota bacterium]